MKMKNNINTNKNLISKLNIGSKKGVFTARSAAVLLILSLFVTQVGCGVLDTLFNGGSNDNLTPDTSISDENIPDASADTDNNTPAKPVPSKTNSDKTDDKDKDKDGSESKVTFETVEREITFEPAAGFYDKDISVKMSLPEGKPGKIYYTINGLVPGLGEVFTDDIKLAANSDESPNVYSIKAIAEFDDGSFSEVLSATYFVGKNVFNRYTTPVVSISGNPYELTEGENAVLWETNAREMKGSDSERTIRIEMFTQDGTPFISQTCGLRPFGGFSRNLPVKSMKLYARKEYDVLKTFKTDIFKTPRVDEPDKVIKSYKRLVLRNTANDFYGAQIRDEFAQMLAADAGLPDTEGVLPVTVYINGGYYGLFWMHENYCDKYFKEKYGDEAPGEFVVIEGTEAQKTSDGQEAADFNTMYNYLCGLDMTDDANFATASEFMDVYNYIDYFIFNMYIANADWPVNNEKVYRYYAAEGEEYGEGVFDGRWRFLPHDMDMSMGIGSEIGASYPAFDNIILPENDYYSPLFAAFSKRDEIRKYIRKHVIELSQTTFKPENSIAIYKQADALRAGEVPYFIRHMNISEADYKASCDALITFLNERNDHMMYKLDYFFPEY